MNERDKYINDLVAAEQAQRTYADDCREVSRYMEGRDKKGDVVPYVAPESETRDTGDLTPSQKRGLKMFVIVGSAASGWAGFLTVCATGALNTIFQVAACGGVGILLLSGLIGSFTGGSCPGKPDNSRCGDNITVNNTINIQR